MIQPGIYTDLSSEDYHADSAISRSGIMHFLKSPLDYWANYINPHRPEKKVTKAMELGTAFHMKILEPHLFGKTYASKRPSVLLKDVGRKKYDEYKNYNECLIKSGYITLENDDYCRLVEMELALRANEKAWALIENATYEQSYFWKDVHSGLMVKSRPDILHNNMIVDLKTCIDASSRAYQREMIQGGYHIQGAMVRDAIYELTGKTINTVLNLCVEKDYPHAIGIKIIGEDALEAGHKKYKQALLDMKACFESDKWESYETEIVELPSWAI